MKLFTKPILKKLITNGLRYKNNDPKYNSSEEKPIVKLFSPDGGFTGLIVEINPDDLDTVFGLFDLGLGFPELGYNSLREILRYRGVLGLPIERDRYFTPRKTLQKYAEEANTNQHISA